MITGCVSFTKKHCRLDFGFNRLHSDNEDIAIFVELYPHEEFRDAMMEVVKNKVESGSSSYWPRPPHIVSVRRMINDTEIPGIHFDSQTQELHCDWKGMFTALLSEQKLYFITMANWVGASLLMTLPITKLCTA